MKENNVKYDSGNYTDHHGDPAIKYSDGGWAIYVSEEHQWYYVKPDQGWIIEEFATKNGWKKN